MPPRPDYRAAVATLRGLDGASRRREPLDQKATVWLNTNTIHRLDRLAACMDKELSPFLRELFADLCDLHEDNRQLPELALDVADPITFYRQRAAERRGLYRVDRSHALTKAHERFQVRVGQPLWHRLQRLAADDALTLSAWLRIKLVTALPGLEEGRTLPPLQLPKSTSSLPEPSSIPAPSSSTTPSGNGNRDALKPPVNQAAKAAKEAPRRFQEEGRNGSKRLRSITSRDRQGRRQDKSNSEWRG